MGMLSIMRILITLLIFTYMITTDNLINRIYTDPKLYQLIERHVFFYGMDLTYKCISKKITSFDIKCTIKTLKDSIDGVFKIKYLIFIQELCHQSLFKPKLTSKIKALDKSNVPWPLVEETQGITSTLITPYLLRDMCTYLNTESI